MTNAVAPPSIGPWRSALRRLWVDRTARVAGAVVLAFVVLMMLTAFGWVARDWAREVAVSHAPPTFVGAPSAPSHSASAVATAAGPMADLSAIDPLAPRYEDIEAATALHRRTQPTLAPTRPLGADRMGRDVLAKALKGSQVSIFVGLLAALVATAIGTVLGAWAGFRGGRVDAVLEWVYNVLEAIPGILLILALAAVFGRGLTMVVLILGLAGWTGLYRQVRAEFIQHRHRPYVLAAQALGASARSRMFRHILPNVGHLVLVRMSLMVVGFIKSEVILSYLGLGVGVDEVSWGTMLAEAQGELVAGPWWQLAAATGMMAIFVTAFSLLAESLRDALDPQHGSNPSV